MNRSFIDSVKSNEEGIFSILNQKKRDLLSRRKEIFDMSIGTPDFAPPDHVMEAITRASQEPQNYKYAIRDIPELSKAVVGHYYRRFGVQLSERNVMSINGSQEGMAHVCFALCSPGDLVLIPNPGYPVFFDGPLLAGVKIYKYPLLKENDFIADLRQIPESIALKAKAIIVSYPMNPVGVAAPSEFYEELISFAQKYKIIVIHDSAYSDIRFTGEKSKSFLSYKGAEEIGIELFSLSKSYNLTGARIAFVVGNADIIKKFRTLRSLIDYGIFFPIQYGAIAALNGDQSCVDKQCAEYKKRADVLCEGFRELGWSVPNPTGSIFVWAPLPSKFQSSEEFSEILMEETGIICTPGNCFGSLGEGYVRFSLVIDVPLIKLALQRLRESDILQ